MSVFSVHQFGLLTVTILISHELKILAFINNYAKQQTLVEIFAISGKEQNPSFKLQSHIMTALQQSKKRACLFQ